MVFDQIQWFSRILVQIRYFIDSARLVRDCKSAQSAGKYFFTKNIIFLWSIKNTAHIISALVAGVGGARELPKQRKS